jgi:mRNA m6A methyltransferase catalytic subunit
MEFSANVAHHLSHLLANPNTAPSWPISSLDLRARFVAHSATSPDPLRFSDLPRFNRTLERFAASHDKFAISLTRTHTSLSIISIKHRASELSNTGIKRRRKDDDDDSAEEEPEELDAHRATPPTIGITKFPKELQEAYAILQRPSAKMRLLAEKVSDSLKLVLG